MDISYKELYMMHPQKAREKMIEVFQQKGNISEVARMFHTSRNTVRKWVKRFSREGLAGLKGCSRRPRYSPRKTKPRLEKTVIAARKATGYGRRRLAFYLARDKGILLSPHTVRHILRRAGYRGKKRPRKVFYPAHWAWEEKRPFSLAQVDTKDVLDKATLGTKRWHHIVTRHLPRYQWTFCEARSRFRLLACSKELTITNGLAFVGLVMWWLRRWGITDIVQWQTDWGKEFGGSNPRKLRTLEIQHYLPFGARLVKIPKGRKGYNGRVERSHLTDDYEFYIPYVLRIAGKRSWLKKLQSWQYIYNVKRPHFGHDMNGKTPLARLQELGYTVDETFAMYPIVILDDISTDWILSIHGNDVLATDKLGSGISTYSILSA
jgi:transposase